MLGHIGLKYKQVNLWLCREWPIYGCVIKVRKLLHPGPSQNQALVEPGIWNIKYINIWILVFSSWLKVLLLIFWQTGKDLCCFSPPKAWARASQLKNLHNQLKGLNCFTCYYVWIHNTCSTSSHYRQGLSPTQCWYHVKLCCVSSLMRKVGVYLSSSGILMTDKW